MNASMNDSHNFAWKLIHVLRGWATPQLLETVCHLNDVAHFSMLYFLSFSQYEFERRKFAQVSFRAPVLTSIYDPIF